MRINNRVIILVIAAFIAAFTAIIVKNKLSGLKQGATVEVAPSRRVLVAKQDLPPGKFVDAANDLEWIDPKSDMDEQDPQLIRERDTKKSAFSGGIVRKQLRAGQPVAPDDITKAGDGGFLSAVLEPGMRAVSIGVTATTGAAGFIAPGDRVDLIVTHRIRTARREETAQQDTVVSETFVRDVRVVAVDQSLNTENKAQLAKNVTVEVNEHQAEQIAVAMEMGKISLALRSALPVEPGTEITQSGATLDSDVSRSLIRQNVISPRVKVIRGDEKEELQFMDEGAQQ